MKQLFEQSYIPEPNSGCWLWEGASCGPGYGQLTVSKRKRYAHHVSWELHKGPIPSGLYVLHRCDVRCCVNPDHLFLGSQRDNLADMRQKRRHVYGSRHYKAKLTEAQVTEIKYAVGSKGLGSALARKFGVSRATVSEIRNGKVWKLNK